MRDFVRSYLHRSGFLSRPLDGLKVAINQLGVLVCDVFMLEREILRCTATGPFVFPLHRRYLTLADVYSKSRVICQRRRADARWKQQLLGD